MQAIKPLTRQQIMKELDKLGKAYNKKAGAAYLKQLLGETLAEKPIEKKPEPVKTEVVKPEAVVPELSEELQEQKDIEEEEPITFDKVRALVSQFAKDFGPELARGILNDEFKVDKLSQIPEDKYEKLVERIGLEIKKQNDLSANTFLG